MRDDKSGKGVPAPPHPTERKQSLPGMQTGAGQDADLEYDSVSDIVHSQTYKTAIEDVEFLRSSQARGVRLQLDYLKPELLMREHGVEHTIVVFGGTRITDKKSSKKNLRELQQLLEKRPNDAELLCKLEVARKVAAKSRYYEIAREFSGLVAKCGKGPGDSRLVVMTGGGPGIMEAANRGASEIGAKTIGLNITLPHEQLPNPYLTPELCFQFNYFALRKMHFMLRARALVAFPGGYGTMDELFETLTLIQTRKIRPLPVVLVGEEFWRQALNMDFLVEEGVIDAEDRDLFWYAETAQEIWSGLNLWYERAGDKLIS